ncbi:N-acetyl-alpha-D-glucosaminyl L-malate synthase BshA [Thalassotalea agarivorans]|uniref:N-acetyl-alpha-D-glucosaminyl L-malate synthase BshA n=1 Tax=Thalassotalea agarivorans TaxID=349064 RepID=A0A1I0GM45_THASX|nr:N-acetyl-alpha-D-glucosaminyl L-malate synthase BshA [Thalassotalea agarivorans]SET72068.1 N-acetyl-alpha-D-glucosaminyl L-malate synthase BshA [Thalassotalea agarivorans]
MKIGIVCHPSIGGSGLVATQLGVGLAKKGHEVHFIAQMRPFKLDELPNVFFHDVERINYPLFDDPLVTFALTAKIVEVATEFQLDIVHAHYSIPHSLSCYLANEISPHKFAVITTIHGTDVTIVGRDKPLFPLNRFSINRSCMVTTVSHFQKHYVEKHFDIEKEIVVVHNFIDSKVFTPNNYSDKTRAKLAAADEKIIMHISNFRPVKNTDTVIKVFKNLTEKVNARLILLGDGPELARTKTMCAELGIGDKVTALGKVRNVETLLPVADCIIQPSFNESFSMVALEAMACGVPPVLSNCDGIPEVVVDGVTGFMADPLDVEKLTDACYKILSDRVLAEKMADAGRAHAIKTFAWEEKVSEYEAVYQQAIVLRQNEKC